MEGGRTIVLPMDGSDQAKEAFEFYYNNVRKDSDYVIVIHALEVPYMATQPMRGEIVLDVLTRAKQAASEVVDNIKKLLKDRKVNGKVVSEFGRPGKLIVELAQQEKAQMIVMGSRGLGTFRRTLMGSVSDDVLHHAHCPVFICRKHH